MTSSMRLNNTYFQKPDPNAAFDVVQGSSEILLKTNVLSISTTHMFQIALQSHSQTHIKQLFSFILLSPSTKPTHHHRSAFPITTTWTLTNQKLLPQTIQSTRNMAIVPTSITVARFPQQPAHKPFPRYPPEPKNYEGLDTVSVKLAPSSTTVTAALDTHLYEALRSIDPNTMLYRADKLQFQPKISLQPDVAKYWSHKAWTDRAVVGDDKYHVFFTTTSSSDGGKLTENRHVGGKVRGDVFVLRLSDGKDANGRRYYVDLEPRELDWEAGRWEGLAGKVERFVEARGRLMAR